MKFRTAALLFVSAATVAAAQQPQAQSPSRPTLEHLQVAGHHGRHRISTLPQNAPTSWVAQWKLLEQKRKIEARKREMFSTLSSVMARPDFGSLGSETGQPYFSGADMAFGFSELYPYTAALQRQSDCSLNEIVGGLENGDETTPQIVQNIPHYEQYLHKVAGLTTTVDKFSNGCADTTPTGVLGMGAYTGKDSSGNYTGGGFNFSDQTNLDIRVLSPSFSQVSVQHVSVFGGGEIDGVMSVDVNGDGYLDFVVIGIDATYQNAQFAVLLNNHNGTFATPKVTTLTGTTLNGLVAGDFNGDGKVDLLASTSANSTYALNFYAGNGDGTFKTAVATSTGTTLKLVETPVDINKDGKLDVIAWDSTSTSLAKTLDVLINNGSAVFTSKQSFTVPSAGAVAAGDLNGDGKLDLAFIQPFQSTLTLAKGDGTGAFTMQTSFTTAYQPSAVTITDLDGDGYQDVAIAYSGGGFFAPGAGTSYGIFGEALLGNNDFTLSTPAVLQPATPTTPVQGQGSFVVADLNGDSKQDVAGLTSTSNSALMLETYLNTAGKLVYHATTTLPFASPGYEGSSMVAADFSGDGKPDLAISGTDSNTGATEIIGLVNNGSAGFTLKTPLATAGHVSFMVAGDFNGDGHQDVAFIVYDYNNPGGDGLYVATGKGDGTFNTPKLLDASIADGAGLTAADLNADGKLDLIAVQGASFTEASTVYVYLNQGSGNFATPVTFQDQGSDYITSVAVADFNKDGSPDLALLGTNGFDTTIYVYTGNKTAKFTYYSSSDAGQDDPTNIAVADINQDGLLDIVQDGCCGNASPSVLLAQAGGKFYPPQSFGVVESALGVLPITLNSDAYPDIIFNAGSGFTPVINNYASMPVTGKAATTITLSTPYPTTQGEDAYITITVTETSGTGIPTGMVTWTFNGHTYSGTIGSGSGYLTLPVTNTMAGSYPVTVNYLGDEFNSPSSATSSQYVQYLTATSLSAAKASIPAGSTASFTATVTRSYSAGTPVGYVDFYGGPESELLSRVALTNGKATLNASTAGFPAGIYQVFAAYEGDTPDAESYSQTLNVTIVPSGDIGTTTALTLTPPNAPSGATVKATIKVTPASGTTQPSGNATIYFNGTSIATVPVTNGTASLSAQVPSTFYPLSQEPVWAVYHSNGKFFESQSPNVTFTTQSTTQTSVYASTQYVQQGSPVTLYISVYANAYYDTPTGTVTIYANGQSLATYPLDSGGASVTVSTATVPVGTYQVTAVYNGDVKNASSTSTAYAITVTAP